MVNAFDIAWLVLSLSGVAAGLWWRRRLAFWGRREFVRVLVLLVLCGFLLLPILSTSDDIGYFTYYFSGGQSPNSMFWTSGLRREECSLPPAVLHALACLLTATLGGLCQRSALGRISPAGPAHVLSRSAIVTLLRAPPSLL